MSEIKWHFLHCGYPKYEGNELIDWVPSYIRLDQIKSIHERTDKNCAVFTYKDIWYCCGMNARDLMYELNDYLSKLKGFSEDEEQPRRNAPTGDPRSASVRETEKHIFSGDPLANSKPDCSS
jgi:hypothetical protein